MAAPPISARISPAYLLLPGPKCPVTIHRHASHPTGLWTIACRIPAVHSLNLSAAPSPAAMQWGGACAAAVMTTFGYLWNQLAPTATIKPDALATACGWA